VVNDAVHFVFGLLYVGHQNTARDSAQFIISSSPATYALCNKRSASTDSGLTLPTCQLVRRLNSAIYTTSKINSIKGFMYCINRMVFDGLNVTVEIHFLLCVSAVPVGKVTT
jgi:hypothetical protein